FADSSLSGEPRSCHRKSASETRSLCGGDHNSGTVIPAFVVEGCMPDPVHQHALRRSSELLEAGVAGVPIRDAKFHLDEFMVGEGALGLGDDRRGDAVMADED